MGSLSINVIPFVSLVAYGLFRHRSALSSASSNAIRHMARFQFLFSKFTPDNYFYGCLVILKHCCICVIPSVFSNSSALQMLTMSGVFALSGGLPLFRQPWRSMLANIADGSISALLNALLLCAALADTSSPVADSAIGVVGTVMVVAIFVCCISIICYCAYRRISAVARGGFSRWGF